MSTNGSTDGPPGELSTLLAIMAKLRDPETGCPWDVEQDFASIAPYTIEEAYEVADAIQRDDRDDLCDELGDLLLQVVFHAQMAKEEGSFAFEDVVAAVTTKMIRRHPHVFGDNDRDDPKAVKARWEEIKEEEKAAKRARQAAKGDASGEGHNNHPTSAIEGVPTTLPALQRAFKLQAKAARVGFDWPTPQAVMEKLAEETAEVADELSATPHDRRRLEDEIGDVLFVVTNLARKLDIDPTVALERTNQKFIKRFQWVEDSLSQSDTPVGKAPLEAMESAWQEAKTKA
ncbi:MAG: nucleoside triphosphate pyrophosphohydrolase [Rhizobiales bacterium]|nr:nucleoside triphosphate pyrophosphohydrolase [Hyphomicrobiales bacterium]MBO6698058.1 nucleoside triphosphate pyrophosphohydrolase [Hyphomicrobiales bacterium]MBO6735688.1 nucleoside triphosphate pyrophosphohydrolase [Hyphomicrobiales bacterium]MBO6910504.1 nucleoside triphosphate pyrophosphohydrolase [Hyphomicrobiales bacterium]MBO6956145.1 nucleoside triphosphate pyrophosphohydrolase [Hyphomicrobiales bacterium]